MKVWDAETGHDLLTLKAGGNGRITFGPDGNWLACDTGGVIKIYDATPLPEIKP